MEYHTFHGLATQLARRAGVALPDHPPNQAPPEYWSTTLPEALVEACAIDGPPFDDLIVDEAQDLTDDYLTALMCTLHDEDDAQVWLFMDANQRVYDADLSSPDGFRLWDLTVNCRNTAAIHEAVMAHYRGELDPVSLGPSGRPVEEIEADDVPAAVARRLARLLGPDEVPPQDVVVLSAHGWAKSELKDQPPSGHMYSPTGAPTGRKIRLSSIRGFRGIESPVVVLCELEDLDPDTAGQQLHTGLSRARNHCIVVRRLGAPGKPGPA